MKFLEIAGSYNRGPDWDIIRDIPIIGKGIIHDMRKLPIPSIADNTYDGVYSEHFIEHLTKDEGIAFFKEMYRIMQPGAVIRTIWPSMDFVDKLNNDINMEDHPYVKMYHQYIIMSERPFTKPYYASIVTAEQLISMPRRQQVALRLMHQEGEHKCIWYKQDLIAALQNAGFKNVSEEHYFKSRFDRFNNIDNKQSMRPHESCVVEAIK